MRNRKVIASTLILPFALLLAAVAPAFATITVTPSSMAFASQTVGTTSAPRGVTLTNLNTGEIAIVRVSCSASQFSYSGPSLPIVLHSGQSLAGTVAFRPSSVQTYSANLVFTRANGSTVAIPLNGAGIQALSITSQPQNQTVLAGRTATFSVTATGTAPLAYQWKKNGALIDSATSPSYSTPATTVADSGAQFTVTVSNAGGTIVSAAATLTVTSSAGTLSLSTPSLNFGSVSVGSSTALSAILKNTGSSSVTVSKVAIAGSGFTTTGVSVGQIILPAQAVSVNVTFAPAVTGSVTGNVSIASNASNSLVSIALSGSGTTASHSVTLSWLASPSTIVGYNVYRTTTSGGPYVKLTSSLASGATYLDTAVQSGWTYYYVVTAVNSNGAESIFSNQAWASIP